jgi:hypothetical protein
MRKTYSCLLIALLFILSSTASGQKADFDWVETSRGGDQDGGYAIATDVNGTSYVVTYNSNHSNWTRRIINGPTYLVGRYSPTGVCEWLLEGGLTMAGYAIALDSLGNIYVAGQFTGEVYIHLHEPPYPPGDCRCITLKSVGAMDVFVAKYTTAGTLAWVTRAGGAKEPGSSGEKYGDDVAFGIACDKSGNAYVAGTFDNEADFGPHHLKTRGKTNAFIAKLDPSGNWLWARRGGGITREVVKGIAVTTDGRIAISGTSSTDSTGADFDTVKLSSPTPFMFVVSYDSAGKVMWGRQSVRLPGLPGGMSEGQAFVSAAPKGDVIVAGTYIGNPRIENDTLPGGGGMYLARYDSTGKHLWTSGYPGMWNAAPTVHAIVADKKGNSYVAGSFMFPIVFDHDTLGSMTKPAGRMMAIRFDTVGKKVWALDAGSRSGEERITGISLDTARNVYVTGQTHATYATDTVKFGKFRFSGPYFDEFFIARIGQEADPLSVHSRSVASSSNLTCLIDQSGTTAQLRFRLDENAVFTIELCDITGRVVGDKLSKQLSKGSHALSIHVGDLPSGVYLVRMIAGGRMQSVKMVLQR